MSKNNLDLDKLRERELPGADTINPIIQWIQHLGCTSDFLYFSNNAYGSLNLDLDFALLAGRVLQLIKPLEAEFLGVIEGENKLEVSAGHVTMPGYSYSLPKYTRYLSNADNGKGLYVTVTTSQAEYSWGSGGSLLNQSTVTLPLCSVYKDGGVWKINHHHIGAYIFVFPPAPFIASWDSSKMQSLDHGAGGSLVWTTYGDCNANGNNGGGN